MTRSKRERPHYGADVRWSDEDNAFVAVSPEWEGLSAVGSSAPEAVEELQAVIALAVEAHEEEGRALPAPRTLSHFSGQFRVRLPRSLHGWLVREAEQEGVSLNTFVVARLSEGRGARAELRRTPNRQRRA